MIFEMYWAFWNCLENKSILLDWYLIIFVSVGLSDDSAPETVLHVYDKSGTYSLSSQNCKEIVDADWVQFTSMWQSIAARNLE